MSVRWKTIKLVPVEKKTALDGWSLLHGSTGLPLRVDHAVLKHLGTARCWGKSVPVVTTKKESVPYLRCHHAATPCSSNPEIRFEESVHAAATLGIFAWNRTMVRLKFVHLFAGLCMFGKFHNSKSE